MNDDLERVSTRIAKLILEFSTTRSRFYADELRSFVMQRTFAAPASPDRILRDLRRKGELNYRVVDRSKSLYEFVEAA